MGTWPSCTAVPRYATGGIRGVKKIEAADNVARCGWGGGAAWGARSGGVRPWGGRAVSTGAPPAGGRAPLHGLTPDRHPGRGRRRRRRCSLRGVALDHDHRSSGPPAMGHGGHVWGVVRVSNVVFISWVFHMLTILHWWSVEGGCKQMG